MCAVPTGTSSVDTLVNSAMDHLIKIVASSSITAKVLYHDTCIVLFIAGTSGSSTVRM